MKLTSWFVCGFVLFFVAGGGFCWSFNFKLSHPLFHAVQIPPIVFLTCIINAGLCESSHSNGGTGEDNESLWSWKRENEKTCSELQGQGGWCFSSYF